MGKVALKLINCAQFQVEEGEFWRADDEDAHSLHYAVSIPDSFSPALAYYFIQRYSGKGEVVFDPFAGRGTIPLESALLERRTIGSDINPVCTKVCRAKLEPVDLVEVALFLQGVNFSRPVALDGYSECFEPFFDADTYREIVNLKTAIQHRGDAVSRFVEMVAMSLLHGHTAGYFSAYSLPQVSVSPDHQRNMNDRRGKLPEYRAIAPRILRKVGLMMRDGDRQRIRDFAGSSSIFQADARSLNGIQSDSVDLVVTSPPRIGCRDGVSDQWLRSWFCGVTPRDQRAAKDLSFNGGDIASWVDFMNSSLFEIARVVRSGGRAILELCEQQVSGSNIQLDEILKDAISTNLPSFWETESLIINRPVIPQLASRSRVATLSGRESRVLVLRRK